MCTGETEMDKKWLQGELLESDKLGLESQRYNFYEFYLM